MRVFAESAFFGSVVTKRTLEETEQKRQKPVCLCYDCAWQQIATMSEAVRVAILGAGIFARETVAPAVRTLPDLYDVRAVYSRGSSSASLLASDFLPKVVDVYHGDGLEKLLARQDIEAIIIVLPIDVMVRCRGTLLKEKCFPDPHLIQPAILTQCLRAGKHVLSEKPASPTVDVGLGLLQSYGKMMRGLVWGVSENWRFEPAFLEVLIFAPSIYVHSA